MAQIHVGVHINLYNSMKKQNLKHKDANFLHFKSRAKQRYNLDIDEANYSCLINMILSGKSIIAKKQTRSRTKHLLKIGKLFLPVVYSNITKSLVTVLPPEEAITLLTYMKWS
jgi:hypothetical protein